MYSFIYLFIYSLGIDGEAALDGPIEEVARMEAQEAEHLLNDFGIPVMYIFLFCYLLSISRLFQLCYSFLLEQLNFLFFTLL